MTNKRLHVAHVSLAEEVKMIRAAKEAGLPISAEVSPHHLYLTEDDVDELGPYGLMKAPLGRPADLYALWDGLKNGVIDFVATDHAPHTKEEKESMDSPSGVPGLETTLPLLIEGMHEQRLSIDDLIRITSTNAREIFGLPKQDSSVLIDTSTRHVISSKDLETKCQWTPFDGWTVQGRIVRVRLRGETVFDGEQVVGYPRGRILLPE